MHSTSHHTQKEKARLATLLDMISHGESVLEAGARDGFVATALCEKFNQVTALDLTQPSIEDPRIECIAGDITSLKLQDDSFDTVVCAEVLEHIHPERLETAARELSRVAKRQLIVGVPYKQDTRVGRATCGSCGKPNPPWGHVNSFDQERLRSLFSTWKTDEVRLVERQKDRTNWFSTMLFDFAGNPFGIYDGTVPCIFCDNLMIQRKAPLSFWQRLCARVAVTLNRVQGAFISETPLWIYIRFVSK